MNLGTSRHRTVSLVISDGIATGRYQPGDALPGEKAPAKMYPRTITVGAHHKAGAWWSVVADLKAGWRRRMS